MSANVQRTFLKAAPRWLLTGAMALLGLGQSGCFWFHRKVKPVPPTIVQPAPPASPVRTPAPPARQPAISHAKPRRVIHRPHKPKRVVIYNYPSGRSASHRAQPPRHSGENTANQVARAAAPPSAPPEITVALAPGVAQQYRDTANRWLALSRNDLAIAGRRSLNGDQIATRQQAYQYVQQAETALRNGDVVSAENLAHKALLLAQALL